MNRRIVATLLALLAVVGVASNGGSPSPVASALPKPAVVNVYHLDVTYQPDERQIGGQLRLEFVNNRAQPLTDVWFHLYPNAPVYQRERNSGAAWPQPGGMTIRSVTIADVAVTPEFEAFHMRLPLPQPLAAGATTTITVDFTTTIPGRHDRLGYSGTIANITTWHPILAVNDGDWRRDDFIDLGDPYYHESAHYRLRLTTPADQIVAATGALVEQTAAGGATTRRYATDNARDFALAISPNFQSYEREVLGTTIRVFWAEGTTAETAQRTLAWAADAFAAYSALFGAYPYADLAVVCTDDGMEYSQVVWVTKESGEFTVAHEVAHQWWYGVVGNDQLRDLWDEGLTNYAAILYYGRRYGEARFNEELARSATSYKNATPEQRAEYCLGCDLYYYRDRGRIYGAAVYRKGAAMFHALRLRVGDDAFFAFLREFYQRYQFATASWSDIAATATTVTGVELNAFFADWLAPGGGD